MKKLTWLSFGTFLLHLAIFLLLDYYYEYFVSKVFLSEGYQYSPDHDKSTYAMVGAIVASAYVHLVKVSGFIYAVLSLLLINLVFPNLIFYTYNPVSQLISFSCFFYLVAVHLLGRFQYSKLTSPFNKDIDYRLFLLFALVCILIIPFFFTFGFSLNLSTLFLDSDLVYQVRAEGEAKNNILTSYLNTSLSLFLIPICLVFAVSRKRYLLVGILFIMLIYLFFCLSMRTILFSIPIIFVMMYGAYEKKIFYLSLANVVIFVTLIYFPSFNWTLEALLISRPFFTPALLNSLYFDFFDEKPLYLSHSVMKYFISYPFEYTPPKMIGIQYFGNPNTHANNGIPCDGFMNFGVFGAFFFAIPVGFLFGVINSCKISPRFFGIILTMVTYIIGGSISTFMLTHGGLLFLLVCTFIINKTDNMES
jgi:hypothetical protein